MPLARREQLLALARARDATTIDDDPYGMLRFAGQPLPSLHELADGDPRVFSVRTFSKNLAPGLRVGWVDTDPSMQPLLIKAKQAMDTCTNQPEQRLAAECRAGGHLTEHLTTVSERYSLRNVHLQ